MTTTARMSMNSNAPAINPEIKAELGKVNPEIASKINDVVKRKTGP